MPDADALFSIRHHMINRLNASMIDEPLWAMYHRQLSNRHLKHGTWTNQCRHKTVTTLQAKFLHEYPFIKSYVDLHFNASYCFLPILYKSVSKLTITDSENSLSPDQRQDITRTNAWILFIERIGTTCSEILIEIHTFSIRRIHSKMSSARWLPFCLGLIVLR